MISTGTYCSSEADFLVKSTILSCIYNTKSGCWYNWFSVSFITPPLQCILFILFSGFHLVVTSALKSFQLCALLLHQLLFNPHPILKSKPKCPCVCSKARAIKWTMKVSMRLNIKSKCGLLEDPSSQRNGMSKGSGLKKMWIHCCEATHRLWD